MHFPAFSRMIVFLLAATTVRLSAPVRAQWNQQFSGTTVRLTDVLMLDSLTAIAVGYGKTIIKTTDAGQTWLKRSSVGFNLNAVAFRDAVNGIAVGDNRMALFTTDGGENWTQRPIGGTGHFLSAVYVGLEDVFIGNDAGALHLSRDGGVTWHDSSLGGAAIYRLYAVRGVLEVTYTGFAVTGRFLYSTTDQGGRWTPSPFPLSFGGSALRGDCSPGGISYVVGYDGGELPFSRILRRGPFDSVWTTYQFVQPSPAIVVRSVSAPSPDVAYACGSSGYVWRTTDSGTTWGVVPTGITTRLNAVDFWSEDSGFVVGDNGTVLFTAGGTTGVVEEPAAVPGGIRVEQNYPNPFNGETEIGYRVQKTGNGTGVTLKVYDLLGRVVATLVDGAAEPGMHAVRFDAAGLPSGIYLYRLQSGAFSQTRKMLLLR